MALYQKFLDSIKGLKSNLSKDPIFKKALKYNIDWIFGIYKEKSHEKDHHPCR